MKLFKKKEKYLPVSIQFDAFEKKKNMVKKPIPVCVNMKLTPNEIQVVKHILYEISKEASDYLFYSKDDNIYKYNVNIPEYESFLIKTNFKVNGFLPGSKKFIEDREAL